MILRKRKFILFFSLFLLVGLLLSMPAWANEGCQDNYMIILLPENVEILSLEMDNAEATKIINAFFCKNDIDPSGIEYDNFYRTMQGFSGNIPRGAVSTMLASLPGIVVW